ncbi:hypothetical protein C8J55DRAFT_566832 [Lentinula edodes]|uniref:Uncharacterized protein n=1 Tax=Lentinula lateritia TaxID=40482 RepID=A0A9W8ZR14_9AGAR|nr:hypothetical protein C8J55DRAFT_566832 [Lentinula edodes]
MSIRALRYLQKNPPEVKADECIVHFYYIHPSSTRPLKQPFAVKQSLPTANGITGHKYFKQLFSETHLPNGSFVFFCHVHKYAPNNELLLLFLKHYSAALTSLHATFCPGFTNNCICIHHVAVFAFTSSSVPRSISQSDEEVMMCQFSVLSQAPSQITLIISYIAIRTYFLQSAYQPAGAIAPMLACLAVDEVGRNTEIIMLSMHQGPPYAISLCNNASTCTRSTDTCYSITHAFGIAIDSEGHLRDVDVGHQWVLWNWFRSKAYLHPITLNQQYDPRI